MSDDEHIINEGGNNFNILLSDVNVNLFNIIWNSGVLSENCYLVIRSPYIKNKGCILDLKNYIILAVIVYMFTE